MPVEIIIVLTIAVFAAIIIYMEYLRSKYVLFINRKKVVIPSLPEEFEHTKVVLVSDLHHMRFGQNNETLARKILLEEPEYILFAGDMGDAKTIEVDAFYDLIEALGRDIPIIAVPGNHDLELGGGRVHVNFAKELAASGAVLLNGKSAELVKGDSKLYLYGYCQPITISGSGKKVRCSFTCVEEDTVTEALGECPQDAPVFLLTHDPTYFARYADWGASLVFAGHNHGGLVRLPFIGGLFGSQRHMFPKYTAGEYSLGESKMFVTTGLSGAVLPRFINPPEICSLTLISTPEPEEPKVRLKRERPRQKFTVKGFFDSIGAWFKNTFNTVRSEFRSLGDLLRERSDQISDFFSEMFGKEKSRFAKKADARKKRNTYTPEKYRKRNGHGPEKKRREQHERLFGKANKPDDDDDDDL